MKIRLNRFFIKHWNGCKLSNDFAFNKLTTDDSKAKKISNFCTKCQNYLQNVPTRQVDNLMETQIGNVEIKL